MHVIISNYGDDSIALIQWAYQQRLPDVHVLYVETGWAAPDWQLRAASGETWVKQLGFQALTLRPKADFTELMRSRGSFPSRKFQWCAGFLKGLPINGWLEQTDRRAEATVLIGRRREASRAQSDLPEFIEESAQFGERKVWHPLYLHTRQQRNALLNQAGFPSLGHRSLECDPCVNSDLPDVLRMDKTVLARTSELERELQSEFLDKSLYNGAADLETASARRGTTASCATHSYELFEMGCGSAFGCGL